MRGRSLVKETGNPSLCAFCAHRLGQARQPSHVQRRFLQSSRPVSKPPAEATALREDNGNRGPQLSWGRPAGGFGPTASWGRSGVGAGIPPAGPSWGRAGGSSMPGVGSTSIPKLVPQKSNEPEPSTSPVESREAAPQVQDAQISTPPSEQHVERPSLRKVSYTAVQPEPPKPNIETYDLDPHEKRAREMMLTREAHAQERRVTQGRGAGEETTRNGRLVPRTEAERIQAAQREIARRKALEAHEANRTRLDGIRNGTVKPKIRHVLGDWQPSRSTEKDRSSWNQLKSQRDSAAAARAAKEQQEERQRPWGNNFVAERSQREEEARYGRYTPISARPDGREFSGRPSRGVSSQSTASPRIEFSNPATERSPVLEEVQKQRELSGSLESSSMVTYRPMTSVAEEDAMTGFERNSRPTGEYEQKENPEEDEETSSRPGREKKRKMRGRQAPEPSYEAVPKGKGRDKARRREQFVNQEDDEADLDAAIARAEEKAQRKREKAEKKAAKAAAPTPILLPEYISVSNLAVALKVRFEEFASKMEELGFEETGHDHILNAENAGLIAQEYNYEPIIDRGESEDLKAREPATDPSSLPQRPPVVTIMGHVDHGKTTLLDYLRKSSVAATEHGGITQHIGAFSVPMPSGKVITFLDTPGHAAFLSMRQRGANVTDIVILVVAADDSVKPQTIEAINHAKAAKVPIIVAINKIDKEDSNIDRVKQDLARHGVDVEDFGGDTQVVCVSGKTGQGMGGLEEAAVTLSEILDMRAETDGQAEGWVLEASIKSMGKVATVLVRRGTMRPGDFIVAGKTWARIRCLRNEAGVEIEEAGPGMPVQIDGWREQPLAGDEVLQASDESRAKSVVDYRLEKDERDKMAEDMEAINENRKAEQEKREREKVEAAALEAAKGADEAPIEAAKDNKPTGPKEVYFIIKGDVSGSVEAVIDSISALGNKEVQPHILRYGVGQLSEFDVEHAAGAKGLLINFNTSIEPNIARMAEQAKVGIIDHNIIYRLVDDVKAELSKHLPPLITQRVLGEAEIAHIFEINVKGRQHKAVAGCKVRNGTICRTGKVRVLRKGEKVFDGTLASLKNVKKDVQEMKKGSECGMGFSDWFDFRVGDQVQSYEEKEEKRYL
ncbi:putative translation initiation factor IF-2, mitochondrial [Leptodontidium sp. MPI-SDFR-AT-0119]|nr:putative translation initiation factor IF-2, mitochondrial [Leptodontidium sp. MPI-SDFR-AT-0119]